MDRSTAAARIIAEVTSWPGVEARPGARGELSFRLGGRELGHLHGDRVAHFGFPKALWSELMGEGRIRRHPIDQPGWGERRIEDDADARDVVDLMRLNFDRITARHRLPAKRGAA